MRFTRFSLISAATVLATAALFVTPAMAASQVNVPFSFVSAGKTFPAGNYILDVTMNRNILALKGDKGIICGIGVPSEPIPSGKSGVVKFDHVGETYLLRSFQYGSRGTPRLDANAKGLKAAEERTIEGGL